MSRPLAPRNPELPIYDNADYPIGSRVAALRAQRPILPSEASMYSHVPAADQALRAALRNCGLREHEVDEVSRDVWARWRDGR